VSWIKSGAYSPQPVRFRAAVCRQPNTGTNRMPIPFYYFCTFSWRATISRLSAVSACLLLTATAALAQSSATKTFLTEAIEGNYAEIQMGEFAQKNGQSDGVRSVGKMLIDDHGQANRKAIDTAKSMNITAPNGPNAKQKSDYDRMARMNGPAFDKSFAQHMVKDHQKDIAAYKKQSKSKDASGEYAQQTLPALQMHLEEAQKLQRQSTKR
jgi:putative membrane protein